MPLVRNVNQTQTDSGGQTRTWGTPSNANSYNNGLYGSYYGGASAGKTGSSLGVYGSQYGGASTNPASTSGTRQSGGFSALSGKNAGASANKDGSVLDRIKDRANEELDKIKQGDSGKPYGGYYYGSSGGDTGGGGGNFSYSANTNDDIVNKIRDLLTEQKNKADEYYRTLYENQLSQNRQGYEANRNQINRNYMRGERYINSIYGNGNSGSGITNRLRNASNWTNNLTTNRQNLENNNAQALAGYNSNLANTANTLAQGWYNYVLPVYENRQINADNNEYAYRRYLASL